MIRRIAVLAAFFVGSAMAQDLILTPQQEKDLLQPTTQAPKSALCSEGSEIPILTQLSPDKTKPHKASFWKNSKQAWLFKDGAKAVIRQAIEYVMHSKVVAKDLPKAGTAILHIPCQPSSP